MFNAIVLQNSTSPGRLIDPGFLAECLIFYRRVIVVGNTATLKEMISAIGATDLVELLQRRRMEFHYKEEQLGVHTQDHGGREYHSLLRFSSPEHTIGTAAGMLHQHAAQLGQSAPLADEIALSLARAEYGAFDAESVYMALADRGYVERAVREIIRATAPGYLLSATPRFRVHREQHGLIATTNIDFERLNREYHKSVPRTHSSITSAWLLSLIQEAHASLFIAGKLDSELGEDPIVAQIHSMQLSDVLSRRVLSRDAIESFTSLVLDDARAIREAVNSGRVSFKEVLSLLGRAERFKCWLQGQEPSADLVRAYYRETVSGTWAEKLPARTARWGVFTALGLGIDLAGGGGVGTVAGIGVSAIDAFLLECLLKGWKPHQFIENELRPVIKRSES
jgi:hypothetical protein